MGVVSFGGAQIGGDVACSGSLQLNANRVALTLEAASIGGALHFHNLSGFIGTLVLSRSRIGCLFDGPVAAGEEWPASLVLTDSRYDSISVHSPMDTTSRLRWLNLHDSTIIAEMPDPQPYRWLAEVMKKQGHEDEARTVLRVCAERRMSGLAERARRDIESNPTTYCGLLAIAWFFAGGCAWLSGLVGTLGTWAASFLILLPALVALLLLPKRPKIAGRIEWLRVSFTQRLYKYAVGHGYARWRAIGWMAAFILLGFVMFSESSHPPVDGRMQPVQALALKEWSGGQASTLVDSLPKYNALIYSADTLIPLVSFHQQDHWMPSGNGRWGWFIKNMYLPFHITMGWVIATLFVASFTRLMRQEG